MKYERPQPLTAAQVVAIIESGDIARMAMIPVSVCLHSDDLDWAQAVCCRLAAHDDGTVRGNALLGFGHLARRFGALSRNEVEPLILAGHASEDEGVRSKASDALEDINVFLGWNIVR